MAGGILDMITSPVTVVTTKSGDKINGMTAAWIAQASFNPAMVMVSIAPERYTHELIKESNIFAVNILADNQIELGKHFGFGSGRNKNKFEDIKFEAKNTGSPILEGCFGYLDCKLLSSFKAGDHSIFIGEVIGQGVSKGKKALIFHSKDFF
ncbi:MAG: flavin reductase [Candidatus Omnitrophica bacterium CG07_land_8_20_14_0_80_42_15]|uniref:Flavin reductase n=1 Tax=Candidatus Aquitaenariimonas noxiae TaxID=1974741 RepID=A0A2J0KS61_9BACT|nr:MAG: flavin reductase [Candidatus Omnitrophica bacterium CG07_land_8_20_14_0_80_42_15]